MRFIGNKESIVEEIESFINSKIASDDRLVLFDAFCGTGSVSDRLKNRFSVVINDNLNGLPSIQPVDYMPLSAILKDLALIRLII